MATLTKETKMGYLTVINEKTNRSVPFVLINNGEIKITSSNPLDDEENCTVIISSVFYEYSIDFGRIAKRI